MTRERFEKLCAVLDRRQPDLTLLLDNVHKPHNFSALLRVCDAVGILQAHVVWPKPRISLHLLTSGSASKWTSVRTHRNASDACAELRKAGLRVLAAHPTPGALDYREYDYTGPTAVVLGAELRGLSDVVLAQADDTIVVPVMGMVSSLNVSVAGALILFEAQHQRWKAGLYEHGRLDPALRSRMLFEWAHPSVAQACRKRGVDYPALDENGEIIDTRSWR